MFCQSSMANFIKTEQELTQNDYIYEVVHYHARTVSRLLFY